MHRSSPVARFKPGFVASLGAALLAAVAPPAHAVLIQTASGTDNTTAPTDDPGFANVGFSGTSTGGASSSAIYLGDGWVLTCNHVGGGGIILASGTYLEQAGTGFSLMTGTRAADLYMYRLQTMPTGLPTLSIAATTTGTGTPVTMIGGGLDRGAFTEWSSSWQVVTGSTFAHAGWVTGSSQAIRWGTNDVAGTDLAVPEYWGGGPDDYYLTWSLTTVFDDRRGTTEAQAVLHDSGGAVFTKVDGQWQLAGVMFAVLGSGQPDPTRAAVFGDVTYIADLSAYRSQILAAVPEPSAAALTGIAAATLGGWRMTRRRRPR